MNAAQPGLPATTQPSAATLRQWLQGKEVVELWFAGPHIEPLKLRDSLKTKVPDNDRDFRLTPGEGGGLGSFIEVAMKVTPESTRRLLDLQSELAPRNYLLRPDHVHVWSTVGNPAKRAQARKLVPEVLSALEKSLAEIGAEAFAPVPKHGSLGGFDYQIDKEKRRRICIFEITPAKRWEFESAAGADQSAHFPELGLMVISYRSPVGADNQFSPAHAAIRKAFRDAIEPLLKLEPGATVWEDPCKAASKTNGALPQPAPQQATAIQAVAARNEPMMERLAGQRKALEEAERREKQNQKASTDEPPIEIRIVAAQTQWEVSQRTSHVLKVTNRSHHLVKVPSFPIGKERDAGIAFYLKEHILKIELARDAKPISTYEKPQARPEKPQPFPTTELQPKETVSVDFSQTLTEPGEYALTVTLDTTAAQGDKILKGRFTSPPARFRIVPIAAFRAQATNESPDDYARAWVAFYLRRIEEQKGEYFPNVAQMLSVQNAVPALIATLDSKNNHLAKRAEAILAEIHHSLGTKENPSALPKSKPEWLEWWKQEGIKLSPKELWSNFDSHYQ